MSIKKLYFISLLITLLLLTSCSIFQSGSSQTATDTTDVSDPAVIFTVMIEEARNSYVEALNYKSSNDTLKTIESFEAALKAINDLSYLPGAEESEAYLELDRSIKEDYRDYIDQLGELPQNVSLFAYEEWIRKEIDVLDIPEADDELLDIDNREEINVGGFKLEINRHVERFIEFFTGRGRKTMEAWLSRSGKYFPMMASVFKEEQVPEQLIFLSMIESGLRPAARSWARAVGMWQFIKSTGKHYDLRVNFYVDERRDPEKATRAAAQHLRDLFYQTGDWYVALAHYNCSYRRIKWAMRQAGSKNYWKIRRFLPRETRGYIPQYIAATLIASQPEKYGFTNIQYERPIDYKTYKIKQRTDLNVLAKCAGINLKMIKEMNPELIQHTTPPNYDGGYPLKIPTISYDAFVKNLESIPEEARLQYVIHTVKKGETLSHIAYKYKVRLAHLAKANNMSIKKSIRPRQKLKIPISNFNPKSFTIDNIDFVAVADSLNGKNDKAPYRLVISDVDGENDYLKIYQGAYNRDSVLVVPEGKEKVIYRVKKYDKLVDIAQLFDVRVSDIRNWNGLSYTTYVRVGDNLNIFVNPKKKDYYASINKLNRADRLKIIYANSGGKWISHRIRRGEVLGKIAGKYGVSVKKIKQWNNLRTSRIVAGKKLQIFIGDSKYALSVPRSSSSKKSSGTTKYKVRRGDNLSKIAHKFRVSEADLKKWNNLKSSRIYAGKTLIVNGNATKKDKKVYVKTANKVSYKIKKGDTLSDIALKYKVSVEALRQWNGITGNNIRAGKKLVIYRSSSKSASAAPATAKAIPSSNVKTDGNTVLYTVKSGDTLGHIAENYGISSREIRKWNDLPNSRIKPGQVLKIYPDYKDMKDKEGAKKYKTTIVGKNVNSKPVREHKVRRGESLIKIAKKYHVRVSDLKEWNDLSNNKIKVGQKLKIH
ncbi:MAG: LysM peptidoglycan-binding domain-containing protein [Rhodothermaceae bacterium]